MAKSCGSKTQPAVLAATSVTARRGAIRRCQRCPRLVACIATQRDREPSHHNGPVVDRGDPRARLLLVGLAPGRLGANRTGRAFVGDSSSDFLFTALHKLGFASTADPYQATLNGVALTNVVKCLPPQNQPVREEIQNCSAHLRAELQQFWTPRARKPRVLVSLGGLAHRALWKALPGDVVSDRACPEFSHSGVTDIAPNLRLLSCFHPSKLNTQTGRLTQPMLQSALLKARDYLAQS